MTDDPLVGDLDDDLVDERRPAAASSALAGLRARRQKAIDELHLDLEVPRYDPPIVVRFRTIDQRTIDTNTKRFSKSKDPNKTVLANAALLAHAVVGVYDPQDPDEILTLQQVGELLEVPQGSSAVEILRELYTTDGDLIAATAKLGTWAGYSLEDVEEHQGN